MISITEIVSSERYRRSLIISLVAIVMACLVALMLPHRPNLAIFLPLYIIGLYLIVAKPEIVIFVMIIFTSTIFTLDAFPQPITFGKVGLYLPEVLMVLLLIRIFVEGIIINGFKKMSSHLTLPLIMLFIWIIFSMINAVLTQRASVLEVVLAGRAYIFYGSFFLVLYYLDTKESINLVLKGLIIVAGICSIFSFIQYIVGPEVRIFPWITWSVANVVYDPNTITLARVNPTSLALVRMFLLPALVIVIDGNFKRILWYRIFVVLALLSLFLSFTRTEYYATILGILLIWLNLKAKTRLRTVRNLIAMIVVIIVLAYLPVGLGMIKVTDWWSQVASRHVEFVEAGSSAETLISRTIETRAMIATLTRSFILGQGIGATYYNPVFDEYLTYGHNGFLSVVFQMGIIGLMIFIIIFFGYTLNTIRIYKKIKDPYYKGIIFGCLISFVTLLPTIWVRPVLVAEYFWIPLLGLFWALPIAIERHEGETLR